MPVDIEAPADTDPVETERDVDDALPAEEEEPTADVKSERRQGKKLLATFSSPSRQALAVGIAIILALGAMGGWLGWRIYQQHQVEKTHARLLQAGRQGALNLTTIDWQHADSDVQRIIASATGTFYDDFSKRAQPFVDVVKQAQSKSQGTITAAGLESASETEAQVLVAVNVDVSDISAPEQKQRSWRMRISVQNAGDDVKVSNVEFVP